MTRTAASVAKELGISRQAVHYRMKTGGLTLDEVAAGAMPARKRPLGKMEAFVALAAAAGVSEALYYRHRREGYTHEEIVSGASARSRGKPYARNSIPGRLDRIEKMLELILEKLS